MPVNAEAVLFDLSGVLYEGSQLVPDANRVVDRARSMGLIVRFVTKELYVPIP